MNTQTYITIRSGSHTDMQAVRVTTVASFGARAELDVELSSVEHAAAFGDSPAEAVDALQALVRGAN